jgi:hypothetical protein
MTQLKSELHSRVPTLQEALLSLKEQLRLPDWAENVGQRPNSQNVTMGQSYGRFAPALGLQSSRDVGKV